MRLLRLGLLVSAATLALATSQAFSAAAGQKAGGDQPKPQVEFVTVNELKKLIANNEPISIIDVRGQSAYVASDKRVKGALHVNSRKLEHRAKNLPRDREVVTYCSCRGDSTSIRAARRLLEIGFSRVRVLRGGWDAWVDSGGQVEPRLGPPSGSSTGKRS